MGLAVAKRGRNPPGLHGPGVHLSGANTFRLAAQYGKHDDPQPHRSANHGPQVEVPEPKQLGGFRDAGIVHPPPGVPQSSRPPCKAPQDSALSLATCTSIVRED